ncbi:hypothetical protein Kisp01_22650 [Kineosporia sp. NBRC 101677]|uniref:calcium-binding protein n=1 Tax=Kineosporia sp. NBRC 101677 TaxID=3032197 RepID=UPI0024A13721|nr:hypothetical protein [Kineosporia sp. NBRC 101677]GLY15250.1 hypothetical protein Kisp01_22650 [Kineosporia sp. NBRC 101677]
MTLIQHRRLVTGLAVTTSVMAAGTSAVMFSGSAEAGSRPATVSIGNDLVFQAAPGQVNQLTITKSWAAPEKDPGGYGGGEYTYRLDDRVEIDTDEDECTYPDASDRTLVVCTFVHGYGQDPGEVGYFNLGDKNDTVKFVNPGDYYANDRVHLGAGNDTYTSNQKAQDASYIIGGAGRDTITTGEQIGDVSGILGGTGNDTIRTWGSYGYAGVQGQDGNDTIYGGAGEQRLNGGAGDDVIRAGAGKDLVWGGPGQDLLYGGTGADEIYGNGGNDKLYGGPGSDTLSGGPGKDLIKHD